jgi:hypothetical protein
MAKWRDEVLAQTSVQLGRVGVIGRRTKVTTLMAAMVESS